MSFDNLKIFPDKTSVTRYTAERLYRIIDATLEVNHRIAIALAGGTTFKPIYELLAKEFGEHIDWKRVHLFFGDERCVPPDHEESNFRMVKEALLDHIEIPSKNVHRIHGEDEPAQAAAAYAAEIRKFFAGEQGLFDLNLLGIGEDAHTASLFPHTEAIHEQEKWVVAHHVEAKGNLWRITLSFPAILQSGNIMFVAWGDAKSKALYEILEGEYQPDEYPSQIIARSQHEYLLWAVDKATASLIK
jgi:6-phosphogluconolactonase